MIDLIGCDPNHIGLAIIVAAVLGCMFGCLMTQYMCNRDWRRYLSLVQQQLAHQEFLLQREPVHHQWKEIADNDLDYCRAGQGIEAQAVVEHA